MSRRVSVLVYGDCPELQASALEFDIVAIDGDDLKQHVEARGRSFDAAIVEARCDDPTGLKCVQSLYRLLPSCPTIMVAEPDALSTVKSAIDTGLTDYLIRAASPEELAPMLTHKIERSLRYTNIKERFHESERRFWTFFDHAPLGLLVMGLNGQCEHANQAFVELVGHSLEDLREMTVEDLLVAEDADIWSALREEFQNGERDFVRLEQQFTHNNGEPRWVHFACVAMRDPQGEPAYFLGMATDQTDRKRIQENLEQADKMRSMGRLAGGVAHDFNNLLTIVNSHCFIMRDATDDPEKIEWSTERIMSATKRGSKLTRQLLTFGRDRHGETETVDTNELLDDMEVVLDSLFGKPVDVDINAEKDLRKIEANRSHIEQVITNLALNARDAMPDGGDFEVRTYNLDVEVPSSAVPAELPHGQYTVIEVSDTGTGMSSEVQKQAFEPFFTTKDVGQGTGLGLSTVYGVVNQNNGHITLDSEEGQGTTFTIYLPSAEQQSETPTKLRRARRGTPTGGTETILLVEDEEQLRLPLKNLLKNKGYGVIDAADAEEALEISHSHPGPIDLLLTDVIMPGIDGVSLADSITQERSETSVILMSGYTADALSMNSTDDGHRQRKLLQKPFGMDILSRAIRRVLNP